MHALFSYGTLQQPNVQQQTFGRLLDGKKETLIGYKLANIRITDQSVIEKSGKAVHPILVYTDNPNDEVHGMIFEISEEELLQADRYEVAEYARIASQFQSGTIAWIYADASQIDLITPP